MAEQPKLSLDYLDRLKLINTFTGAITHFQEILRGDGRCKHGMIPEHCGACVDSTSPAPVHRGNLVVIYPRTTSMVDVFRSPFDGRKIQRR